ncbi:hypothetical protein ACHAQJ_007517 [Trichoderma viride]
MDGRGMSNTPKSLSNRSSRPSEANTTTSESSVNVPERRELRKIPTMVTTRNSAVESPAVGGVVKTNGSITPGVTVASSKLSNVIFMRPRYSRRVQSKSEPPHTSPASGSVACNESPAKRTDDTTPYEQRRVSAPVAQGSPGSSLIPRLGIRGSFIARQLPIPPRNSSDGKCGAFPTSTPKENAEGRLERIPRAIKDIKEPANMPATPPSNENQPPPKTGENQSTMTASSRGIRSIRRLRNGSLRGRRGRVFRTPSLHKSSRE